MEKSIITKTPLHGAYVRDEVVGESELNVIIYFLFLIGAFLKYMFTETSCEKVVPIKKAYITKNMLVWIQCGYIMEVSLKDIEFIKRKCDIFQRILGYEEFIIGFRTGQEIRLIPIVDTMYFLLSLLIAIKDNSRARTEQ